MRPPTGDNNNIIRNALEYEEEHTVKYALSLIFISTH